MATTDIKDFIGRLLSTLPFLNEVAPGEPAKRSDVPWTEPAVPLREAVLAVITTGGVHLRLQPPFYVADPDGDPGLREIPIDTPRDQLQITRDFYDCVDAETDLNLVLPVQRLMEFQRAGALGALHPVAFSIMGHLAESKLKELMEKTAVQIVLGLAAAGVDYALLVPA